MRNGAENYVVEDILGAARSAWNTLQEEIRHTEDQRYTYRMSTLKERLKAVKAEWNQIAPSE